jgi:hypothetical protein
MASARRAFGKSIRSSRVFSVISTLQVVRMSLAEIYVVPVASAIIRRNSEASEVGG